VSIFKIRKILSWHGPKPNSGGIYWSTILRTKSYRHPYNNFGDERWQKANDFSGMHLFAQRVW